MAFLALTSGSIWFGAYIARLLTTYQMFEPTELVLKNFITSNNLPAIIQTTFPLVNLTFAAYLILIFSFTLFLISTQLEIKRKWLVVYYFDDYLFNSSF